VGRFRSRRRNDIRSFIPALVASVLALAACTAPQVAKSPLPLTPPEEQSTAPVVRRPLPEPPAAPTPPSAPEIIAPAPPPIVMPPHALYVCVTESAGQRQQTVIEFSSAKVRELCSKHPEMGPCQYEREMCRRNGGRVFAANNQEITLAIEEEYDRKVMRVRFKSN
jgi:hypothetical protein